MREELNKYGELIESLETSYARFFYDLAWDLIPVLSGANLFGTFKDIDAIILTGGGTVPNKYRVSSTNEYQQKARDYTEKILLDLAIKNHIPVIGICRGMQFINGYFGGKIDSFKHSHPTNVRHNVILKNNEMLEVNSFHQDAVTVELLAPGFIILASDPSRVIVEAMYSSEYKIIAFQWHPEREKKHSACQEYSINAIQNFIKKGDL